MYKLRQQLTHEIMRIEFLTFLLLIIHIQTFAQNLTLCDNVETIEEIESVYKFRIDSDGNIYTPQGEKVDDLEKSVLKTMISQFKESQKIHINKWFIELDSRIDNKMQNILPWIKEFHRIGFPKILYPAKSENFESIDGIWRTGLTHQLTVLDSEIKVVDQFLEQISIPPPPPDFPGDKNEFYVYYNIPIQLDLDTIYLEVNHKDFQNKLNTKIDKCFTNNSCYIFINIDPKMEYEKYIQSVSKIKDRIMELRHNYAETNYNKRYQSTTGKDRYEIDSRYPIFIETIISADKNR